MSDERKPIKKSRRTLSPFICRELLYDYVTGDLDEERRAAVAQTVESDRETREAHDFVVRGLAVADEFAASAPSTKLLEAIMQAESAVSLGKRYARWRNWPRTLRTSLVVAIASALLGFLVTRLPFGRLSAARKAPNAVVLAPIEKNAPSAAQLAEGLPAPGVEDGSGDDVDDTEEGEAPQQPTVAAAAKNAERLKREGEARALREAHAGEDTRANEPEPPPAAAEKKDQKAKSFVYRAWLKVEDVEAESPKIVDIVSDLGGTKAGEVDLGWRKGAGAYFHFALPAKNEEDLLDRLKAHGRVRISKDPHPRVMPAGQVRFILWVEADRAQ